MLTLDDLKREVKEERIDTVLVCFPDMFGRLVGKRFHARFFLESAHGETHACDYLLADDIDMEPVPGYKAANWARGYGDFVMKPDLRTLRRIPWLEATALVLCDVEDHHHKPVDHSPRAMLQKQLARLEAHGLKAMMASELEFYLFDESYRDISDRNFQEPRTSGTYIQDYHILQTTREEPVLRAMRNGLEGAGIPVENSKGEWGPGQEELNIEYSDALSMADRHVIMKNGMKEIADAHGKAITFMAKWKTDLAGSSCHIHLSLQDGQGSNVFCESKDEHGMSDTMRHFMAGQLAHASDITYFLAPFINSYKRFQAGTFAPTKAIWSRDNRTAGFRLCGEGGKAIRSECRIGGADLNPYLAFAALIAAGLDGIENKRALEDAYMGDAYTGDDLREIPKTLREAIVALDGSAMLREALGDHVIEHYVHTARWEQSEFDRQVTDWEVKRGFERS
ncbi:MAG: glutamine synthetase family protein [Rhodothermales bacterium]|nr:glutamine synthetase family protein [Rhodothermales bacterium]MDG2016503.1 glutamine synthetase family protein [Rhodothermales bacterium]